jgi:hypothetical protein
MKIVKTLKIISIVSFLLICGLDEIGLPIFISIPYMLMIFFQDLSDSDNWILVGYSIFIILTLIFFLSCRQYKDRYLLSLCFITLLTVAFIQTGISNLENYIRITNWFIFPSAIFIISSVLLIILNFKKPENKTKGL